MYIVQFNVRLCLAAVVMQMEVRNVYKRKNPIHCKGVKGEFYLLSTAAQFIRVPKALPIFIIIILTIVMCIVKFVDINIFV